MCTIDTYHASSRHSGRCKWRLQACQVAHMHALFTTGSMNVDGKSPVAWFREVLVPPPPQLTAWKSPTISVSVMSLCSNSSLPPPLRSGPKRGIMLVEFLCEKYEEFSWRGATALGYMHAYAQITRAQMLAILVHARGQVYEVFFSFDSPTDENEFLRLLQANETTAFAPGDIVTPPHEDIDQARPLVEVLPDNVMRQVLIVSAMARPVPSASRPN